ncbi:hypothetical protein HPB50_018837 [Hyalomma asiaticum]|uniref:Uncharacterized protein n=1 Tax=Hyalomma asiaticum TaxID=266040 RepID=A0ACB7SH24_HYAAI|nr:hypothetical protein HPB50_018837 [Hyalomma asiaticum]
MPVHDKAADGFIPPGNAMRASHGIVIVPSASSTSQSQSSAFDASVQKDTGTVSDVGAAYSADVTPRSASASSEASPPPPKRRLVHGNYRSSKFSRMSLMLRQTQSTRWCTASLGQTSKNGRWPPTTSAIVARLGKDMNTRGNTPELGGALSSWLLSTAFDESTITARPTPQLRHLPNCPLLDEISRGKIASLSSLPASLPLRANLTAALPRTSVTRYVLRCAHQTDSASDTTFSLPEADASRHGQHSEKCSSHFAVPTRGMTGPQIERNAFFLRHPTYIAVCQRH